MHVHPSPAQALHMIPMNTHKCGKCPTTCWRRSLARSLSAPKQGPQNQAAPNDPAISFPPMFFGSPLFIKV